MGFINMRCDNKSVLPFGKAHRQFITGFVCFFRRYFTGLKRLPDLIGQHIVLPDSPSRHGGVLPLRKEKFRVHDSCVTAERGHQPAAVGFIRIFGIIRASLHGFRDTFPFSDVHGNETGSSHEKFTSRWENNGLFFSFSLPMR